MAVSFYHIISVRQLCMSSLEVLLISMFFLWQGVGSVAMVHNALILTSRSQKVVIFNNELRHLTIHSSCCVLLHTLLIFVERYK